MSTLAQFRTEVSAIIGLDNTASSAEQSLIDRWVNEGVTDVLLRTSCKIQPATTTLTSGTADYTLDTNILKIEDAYLTSGGNTYKLELVTPQDLYRLRYQNAAADGPVTSFSVTGANLLMVYPTPSAADTVTLLYVPRPSTLSAGTDTPSDIPAEWHRVVALYALWRAADYDEDTSSSQGQRYYELYNVEVRRMRAHVTGMGSNRLAKATDPRRRRRLVRYSNSQDV